MAKRNVLLPVSGLITIIFCLMFFYGNVMAASNTIVIKNTKSAEQETTAVEPVDNNVSASEQAVSSEQRRAQRLEELKQNNPEAYARIMEAERKREERIRIVSEYRSGKITLEQARQQMREVVKNEVDLDSFAKRVDEKIKSLEEQIEKLKKQKKNPQLVIDEKVDAMLGVRPDINTANKK